MAMSKTLRLILGDQLNSGHSWFQRTRKDVVYVLMEMRQETDYVRHHIQKVVGFFAAMRHFAISLRQQGHQVIYLRLDAPDNTQDLETNLRRLIRAEKIARFAYLLPDEYRLDRQLQDIASRMPVPATVVDSEHFLTTRHEIESHLEGKKRYLMEYFYRQMRRKYGILMEDDGPAGGRWNYDQRNRNRYDGAVPLPEVFAFRNEVEDIAEMIDRCGVKTMGAIAPKCFNWPISRTQALEQLDDFVRHRLSHFGTYQDAMTLDSGTLFHSRLSFALNTKMLHPMEVIQAALDSARKNGIDIAQLEGFVRQVLGWREYMRGIYWTYMPDYATLNTLDHQAALPDYYWTAETGMNCMQAAIGQSLAQAYAHHIQRLMVTGNFALLAGVHPDHLDAWYLGIYMDAIQWVEIVNTRGMSQFADGGIVATKPYIASANYINKMSDYCPTCRYSPEKRFGERACPFNSLYWDFLHRHRTRLQKNPRVGMMYRTWDRMGDATRRDLLTQAAAYRKDLNSL
jgi:deoxyribodipyrimidine photolyase-related protein